MIRLAAKVSPRAPEKSEPRRLKFLDEVPATDYQNSGFEPCRLRGISVIRKVFLDAVLVRPKRHDRKKSINFVHAAGLRPQDSAFVGLSNFPSFDRNHADEELGKLRFGFF